MIMLRRLNIRLQLLVQRQVLPVRFVFHVLSQERNRQNLAQVPVILIATPFIEVVPLLIRIDSHQQIRSPRLNILIDMAGLHAQAPVLRAPSSGLGRLLLSGGAPGHSKNRFLAIAVPVYCFDSILTFFRRFF